MIITIIYILISFILFYVTFTGIKAMNIGIEAKKRNKSHGNSKKLKKKKQAKNQKP